MTDHPNLLVPMVEYCPMHEAAPELLEALKEIEFIGRNARSRSQTVHMGNIARQALALVEGDKDG